MRLKPVKSGGGALVLGFPTMIRGLKGGNKRPLHPEAPVEDYSALFELLGPVLGLLETIGGLGDGGFD